MGYDIFDTETGNLWASFKSEAEALAEVQRAVKQTGPESVATWAMGRSDRVGPVLFGHALIERAVGAAV